MVTLTERVGKLEMRLDTLETWSGPGQAEALRQGQLALRTQIRDLSRRLGGVGQVQERHTRLLTGHTTDLAVLKQDVAVLKQDVAVLKQDVAWLKAALSEVLRRLPETPG
jgi:uncharacterized protein involved in exopolysaccharide biosynthesis